MTCRPAIITPIGASSIYGVTDVYRSWQHHAADQLDMVDVIEWRVDSLGQRVSSYIGGQVDLDVINKPILATWRSADQGGATPLTDSEYAQVIRWLAVLDAVDYVDVESVRQGARSLVDDVHAGGKKVVMSFHDFQSTPDEDRLIEILIGQNAAGADVCKVAVMPHNNRDVVSLLAAINRFSQWKSTPVIGIAMGKLGQLTRVVGYRFGSAATFATIGGQQSAPGQWSVADIAHACDVLGMQNP